MRLQKADRSALNISSRKPWKNQGVLGIVVLLLIAPSLAMMPVLKEDHGIRKVIIDAGHGGKDPGNLGTGRYKDKEKDVSLDVALLLESYIKKNHPDVEVIMTRKTDKFLELRERTTIANREKGDLFISIHCNSATPAAYGTETYVMGQNHDDENRVALRENSVIYLEDNYEEKYEGFDPAKTETYIILSLYQNAFQNQSLQFAQLIQDEFRDRAKRRDRGVRQEPLYVTSRSSMPAVLVELGFLTNKSEEDFMMSSNGKDLLASAIYRAFRDYKEKRETIDALLSSKSGEKSVVPEQPVIKSPDKPIDSNHDNTEIIPATLPIIKVQIAVSGNNIETLPQNFSGLNGVEMYQEGKLYKYTYGSFSNRNDADKALKEAKLAGFKDAYLVAFLGDKKISVQEAERLLQ